MTRPRYPAISVVLVMTLLLLVGYAVFGAKKRTVSAQGILPAGSYGFLVNTSAQAPQLPAGTVGVISFDGAGGVTGSFTNYDPGSGQPLKTGTFTGTYSSNADGNGSFTITSSLGATTQWAMVMSSSQSRLSVMQTGGQPSGDTSVATGVATLQ